MEKFVYDRLGVDSVVSLCRFVRLLITFYSTTGKRAKEIDVWGHQESCVKQSKQLIMRINRIKREKRQKISLNRLWICI